MGRIKKLKETDLVGGAQSTDVYPITSTLAVYDGQNKVLESYLTHLRNTATFGGIATPTTNPGTPTSKVFYIAKEKGTYQYFGKVITEDEVIILLWDSTWRKLSTGIPSKEKLDTKQDIIPDLEDIRINANKGATALQPIQNITYAELVALRNSSSLVPGRQYRITDYQCTTTQGSTKSAGHQFDIIVRADSENRLNEEASAIQHEGDEYFANSNLSAWKIWYCLDNDKTRFAWADETNGKGVIYRMIDEFNNDIPYDFKNIKFYGASSDYPYYYYTFASSNVENNTDYSLNIANKCYSNTIKEYISNKRELNNIVFIGSDNYFNIISNNCNNIIFNNNCYSNIIGNNCFNIIFGSDCNYNTIGNNCHNNTFCSQCSYNNLGNSCYYISFKSTFGIFWFNHFGDFCNNIIFKDIDSKTAPIQNYNFDKMLSNITIVGERGRKFETKVEKDSSGNLKIYCLADIIYGVDNSESSQPSYPYSTSFIGDI